MAYAFKANPDGSYQQFSQIQQGFTKSELVKLNGTPTYSSTFSDAVAPTDTLLVDASGNATAARPGEHGDLSVLQLQRRLLE